MKPCPHDWRPLVKARTFAGVFFAAMEGLSGYDRCALCGRVGWTTRSRFHRRKFVTLEHQEKLLARAAEFVAWEERQKADPTGAFTSNPS